jgi:hypothetical protein
VIAIQAEGSVACVASSSTSRSKVRSASSELPAVLFVVQTTSALASTSSIASSTSSSASANSSSISASSSIQRAMLSILSGGTPRDPRPCSASSRILALLMPRRQRPRG